MPTYRVESTMSNRELVLGPHSEASSESLRTTLRGILRRVNDLRTWPDGWNGYDVSAPNSEAIGHAMVWITQMYRDALAENGTWYAPQVAADEDGDVMFEWWNREKALTVYVSNDDVRYIKGWGLDAESEMEDGEPTTPEIRRTLWTWLIA
jgi:hypothetical protein